MRWSTVGYGLSILVHLGLGGGVASIPKQTKHASTAVTVVNTKKPEKKNEPDKPPKPVDPPKSIVAPRAQPKAAPQAPPPPSNTPPPALTHATPAGHEAMAALPDFGLSLGGTVSAGGIAVPVGNAQPGGASSGNGRNGVKAAAPKTTKTTDVCDEDLIKPKQINFPQPAFTDEARSANIEGKVTVELTVDENGNVIEVKVIKGLGHGLDEATISAAKRAKFSPATRCGKPVHSTFLTKVRFDLGE